MESKKRLEFRGGSGMALLPFIIFIFVTIALSFANFQNVSMMVGAGVVALLIGMIFCKDVNGYWDVILEGLGSKVAMTAVMLWLVVGIYGNILKSGHIMEGLVWLSVKMGVSGRMFTSFYNWAIWIVMLVCCITGFGRAFEGKNGEYIKAKKNPNK